MGISGIADEKREQDYITNNYTKHLMMAFMWLLEIFLRIKQCGLATTVSGLQNI